MPTLELTLQRKTDSSYPVIAALTRPGGFLPLRREGTLTLDFAALAELQYDPLAYGTALGQALFVDEIRDTFVKALGDEPLRILLSIEAPDLRALDWHRLAAPFDGRWRFLASQQNTPFSLAAPSPASAHFPALGRRDLRALVLVAGPESLFGDYKLASFDVAATTASIQAALGDIACDVLDNPSLDALCAALTATPYALLHLVCHGAVNERGETILYFPKDERRTPTPATDLLNRLGSLARLPHFVFLSACESALPQNGLGSLAGRLVRELGLPAVLAMTDRVSIATAGAIAAPFYAHLYQHGQPDLALAQSLAGLQGAHDLTVPALLSRLGDRPLFDDNSERALTEKELEFGFDKLAESLPERAPVLDSLRDSLTRRLRSTLGADGQSLPASVALSQMSESSRTERKETLDQLNSLSLEALDLSFNALCLGQTPPAYDPRSPFRGLESFRPEDAAFFFGRETLTRKLVQKLNEHNFLAILGASGSGKSSVVMAGLVPALNVPYAIFRPGAEPLSKLDAALKASPQLLVVDQFEELFTLSAREQRPDFISRLLEQSQKIRVVITLRADFLGEVAPFKSLKDEVENHQAIIPPMDEAELRRAMEGQVGCAGLRFESDLSQQMLDDVSGEPGAMPLLQHALWTLWTRRHGRWLRAEEYRAFGGVKQAIASTAEAVFARCSDFEKERLRDIFLRLTRLDDSADGRDTRRRVLLRDLIPADSDPAATTLLIKQLADARLLVVVTGDEVEVAHEALIRHWERLRAWLNDDRDNLRLRESVSDDARRWENANRDESLLNHRGPRLELALTMSKNPRYRLNPIEQAYLDGCVGFREREKAAAAKRRKYIIAGVSMALVVIMAILAGWGWTSNENSKQLSLQIETVEAAKSNIEYQRNIALARSLEAQSQTILDQKNSKQQTAVLLAIQSMKLDPSVNSAIVLQTNTLARVMIQVKQKGSIYSVESSPDGSLMASGGCDQQHPTDNSCPSGTVHVWNISTGKEIIHITHDGAIYSIAFSPDSKYMATGSQDGTVRIWDATTGKEIARMAHNAGYLVDSVVFSPNGKYVLSTSWDNTVRVWNVVNGKEIARMTHEVPYPSAVFSPDGKYVLSSGDVAWRIWDASNGKEITRKTHDKPVYSAIFSKDGKYVLSNERDTVYVWNIETNRDVMQVEKIKTAHQDYEDVGFVAFSPNSDYFVIGGQNGTIHVWSITAHIEVAQMVHDGAIRCVAFSSDGKYIVSGSEDGTARVWETVTGKEIARMTYDDTVFSAKFSLSGKYVISGSGSGVANVWEITTDKDVTILTQDRVTSVAISQNGKYVGSGHKNGTISVWETATGKKFAQITQDGGVIDSLTFSPDNNYIVAGSWDSTARVWDMSTGKEVSHIEQFVVTSVSVRQDGKYILSTGQDNAARVWETNTGKEIAHMYHDDVVWAGVYSPDGKYVLTGSQDHTARIWEAGTGKEIARMYHNDIVWSVAFSPDGKYVLTGSQDHTARIWEAGTGKEIARMYHNDIVWSVAFSPDGKYVLTGSQDHTARIWEAGTGKEIARMYHNDIVWSVAFSPDGKYLLTGCQDGVARVWGVDTGNEVIHMVHEERVDDMAFSLNGKYVVSATAYAVKIWKYRPDDLIAETCSQVTRNLTRAEWQQYIGDALPYQAVCPNLPIEPEPTETPTP